MSPTKNIVRLAEEHYKRGDLQGAIKIVHDLMCEANTSENHQDISQILVAYEINWDNLRRFTLYKILRIKNPLCDPQLIQIKYEDIMAKLCPDGNKSVAAKSAFEIINYAWKILSNPVTRRDYNMKKGFTERFMFQGRR
ncbi:PREDICTED: uncharacterized protein LOC104743191 [Camelina sativa]|uniref:Uncharacterized protein LOC104743191 n=1 Tax=Camelina sativa TaxID=90675 RepID=A0ABM0VXM6_CAMSA|nr:PREDICTED: uncharacterized protein LOC104743191 [Camelina sativa]